LHQDFEAFYGNVFEMAEHHLKWLNIMRNAFDAGSIH
jgi:hypothetical protein